MKAACFDHATGYQSASDYIIAALSDRVYTVVATYNAASDAGEAELSYYVPALLLLLETMFFFYNVHPTVSSSHKLAQAAIVTVRFTQHHAVDGQKMLMEQILRWCNEVLQSLRISSLRETAECTPLETLNVLLILGELDDEDVNAREIIEEFSSNTKVAGYFEIVTYLYCVKGSSRHAEMRDLLFERGVKLIESRLGLHIDSEAAHLALDLLACPYIGPDKRARLFNQLRKGVNLPEISFDEAQTAMKECEATPWFVNWKETDLLRLIRKKELSSVY